MCSEEIKKLTLDSQGEQELYLYLRDIFPDNNFEKVRPDWLKNPLTGHNMELDFYCEELRLAIEYQGIQHYKFSKQFHQNDANFAAQLQRDEFKRKICQERGITLLEISYKDNIYEYLKRVFVEPNTPQEKKSGIIILASALLNQKLLEISPEDARICRVCKESKNISEFAKNKSYKDGIGTICKKCDSDKRKKYYQKQKQVDIFDEEMREYQQLLVKISNPLQFTENEFKEILKLVDKKMQKLILMKSLQ